MKTPKKTPINTFCLVKKYLSFVKMYLQVSDFYSVHLSETTNLLNPQDRKEYTVQKRDSHHRFYLILGHAAIKQNVDNGNIDLKFGYTCVDAEHQRTYLDPSLVICRMFNFDRLVTYKVRFQ